MCWWPCCHRAIYRVDQDGVLVWKKDWGPAYAGAITWARTIDTDGTYIYVGGTRSTRSGDHADVFSVICLDANGSEVWKTDVGGQVRSVRYVAGLGLLVGHFISHAVSDTLVITRLTNTTDWTIAEELGSSGTLAHAASAATVQAALEAIPSLTGKVTVSGASVSAGFTITYDSSLGGMTGKKAQARASAASSEWSHVSASSADVTLLDESDGSIIWATNVRTSTALNNDAGSPTFRVVPFGGGAIVDHPRTQTTLYSTTVLDSAGAVVSQHALLAAFDRGMDSDGTNYYRFITGADIRKYDGSHATAWTASGTYVRPIFYDAANGDLWSREGTNAKKFDPATGSVTDTVSAFAFEDLTVMSDGGIAIVAGSNGGTDYGVHKYDSGGSFDWSYADGSVVGQCCCAYGDDVIMGTIRQ